MTIMTPHIKFSNYAATSFDSTCSTSNPTPHVIPEGDNATALEVVGASATDKLVIIMVGLPARGKTSIAKRICRYLNFFHNLPAEIFNASEYRRKLFGANQHASFYYDDGNTSGLAERNEARDSALTDMIQYMKRDGVRVGVYDATNSTKERRKHVLATLHRQGYFGSKMLVECICEDEEILEENIRTTKQSSPDYMDVDPALAVKDFNERMDMHKSAYEEIEDAEGSYIKVFNYRKFIVHNLCGYLPLKVVHFIMNLHTLPRTFYLTRHGQSEYNLLGKIGGDAGLSNAGVEYARRLATFLEENVTTKTETTNDATGETTVKRDVPARLWTSTLRRTKETAQFIQHPSLTVEGDGDSDDQVDWIQLRPMERRNLDELYAGVCDGMTYKEIEEIYPEEFKRRQNDKLAYRYPRGESYMDVILRLEPLTHSMERTREPIVMIGHQGILRIIYAYFMGLSREEAPYVSIPLNTVIQLTPHAYGCHEKRMCLMRKDEMLSDGQDEPVTSMPLKDAAKIVYNGNDPVMNAPSC